MKRFMLILISSFSVSLSFCQQKDVNISVPDPAMKIQKVEAACGECQFEMKGPGCDLAVRIKGKTYFVDGTNINDHGDAHSTDGFCNAVRKAEVQGKIKGNRFQATYFKLIQP